ncbi:MAG: DJ-1/PfpI family protein [Erysipelotrichaceae bacterium]|nr:DJ-1/PfpI family protein [Erysipelotrichaceae bacterium]MDY5252014.1 DJ-1 family glyoxalase III [Erysipelotrichaceae bacterium]
MKAVIYCAQGFEECEALIVVDMFRRCKVDIDMIGMDGELIVSSHGVSVKMDGCFADYDPDGYDVHILPGGLPGTTNLQANEGLIKILQKAHEKQQLVCAICAAPSVLAFAKILDGKKATAFPAFRKYLINSEVLDVKCVQDGNIITASGLGAAFEFAKTILENIIDKEEVKKAFDNIGY